MRTKCDECKKPIKEGGEFSIFVSAKCIENRNSLWDYKENFDTMQVYCPKCSKSITFSKENN